MKELRVNNTTGLRRAFAFVTALAAVLAGAGAGLAQGPVTNLMIPNVDSSNAPDYTLRVSALTPDGAGIADLAQDQFSITAGDGAPIPISSAQPYNAGVAVIIVADLGGLDQKSPRGATYQAEVESVARQLVQSLQKNSPNQEDYAGMVAVTGASDVGDVKFGLLLTPTNDLGLAANSLEPIKSMKAGPTTALFDGLNKALDMLAIPELEHMRKVIVAFSDGADQKFSGDAILGNIPVRAREGKVIIYSLQAHMRSDVEAKNMNVLAVQSGGKYALIDAKPEAISAQLEQIFSLINSQAVQYVLNFRSVRSQGDYSARLSVNTPAGNFGQDFHFTSNVIPPTVQLVEPSTGKSYNQAGVKPVEPITLTASVTFPNGKERPVTVEFRADDKHIGDANQAPYQFVWKPAAETLADAAQTITHSLNAVLKDSWLPNTTAESNRIEVSFKIAIRPTPTPRAYRHSHQKDYTRQLRAGSGPGRAGCGATGSGYIASAQQPAHTDTDAAIAGCHPPVRRCRKGSRLHDSAPDRRRWNTKTCYRGIGSRPGRDARADALHRERNLLDWARPGALPDRHCGRFHLRPALPGHP